MREANWQVLDKDQIIDLVVKHNAGVEVTPEIQRRIKNKLDTMDAVELWAHIRKVYGGKLYEPESYTPTEEDLRERRLREKELEKARKAPRSVVVNVVVQAQNVCKFSIIDEAYNDIYGKNCVKRVFDYHDGKLVVVMEDITMTKKLRRWVTKHYPTVQVVIIGEE
jgi:hypothetical protein